MQVQTSQPAVQATTTLELRVPRGKPGDLVDGVETVLERVDGVRRADVDVVSSVRPSPADLYVTATVRVTLANACEDAATVRTTLRDGFGVIDVATVSLDRAPNPG